MGIHYDYKSTRGEKAMKKEAKKKARLEQRRAKKANFSKNEDQDKMRELALKRNLVKRKLFKKKKQKKHDSSIG